MSMRPVALLILIGLAISVGYGLGVSTRRPAAGAPAAPAAALDLRGPTPRDAQGKPDLSGVWQAESAPREIAVKINPNGVDGAQTLGEDVPSKQFMNVMFDLKPDEVVMTPLAQGLVKERNASFSRDIPSSFCLPLGIPMTDTALFPRKIVQTPSLVVILYDELTMHRQIFLDGRTLPPDPEPAFNGHSLGRWEGDTLVVDVVGFKDNGWLDAFGHPASSELRVTERFTRRDVGTMDVQVTVTDPKMYSSGPFTFSFTQRLLPKLELTESVCENEKFRAWVAKQEAAAR
jgi:hypothetical protein